MTNILREIKEIILENAFIIVLMVGPALFAMSFDAKPNNNQLSSYEKDNIVLADYALNCLNVDQSSADQYSYEWVECLSVLSKIKANQELHNKYITRICL